MVLDNKRKTLLTENDNHTTISLRLDIIKLVYSPVYSVSDAISKATEIENYILGNTPQKKG
jgi:hypothetical protein